MTGMPYLDIFSMRFLLILPDLFDLHFLPFISVVSWIFASIELNVSSIYILVILNSGM